MIKWLKKNWGDPVWSKVIADVIKTVLYPTIAFICIGIYSLISSGSFFKLFIQLFTFKIELWLVILTGILIFLIWTSIKRNKKKTQSDPNVLIDLNNVGNYDLEIELIKGWKDGKEVGDVARGSFNIEHGSLNINRTNTDGRFLIRFINYYVNNQRVQFIKSNLQLESIRRLFVTFEAKTIGGAHTFRVTCKKHNSTVWVHNASVSFRVDTNGYQRFGRIINVPIDEDFIIQMDDIEVESPQSSIQIKDFKVFELF